jgi:hypothetical protein
MTAYQNCKVGEITSVTIHSGDAGGRLRLQHPQQKKDLSSCCHLRRGETPSMRGPRSRGLSKWLSRSRPSAKARVGDPWTAFCPPGHKPFRGLGRVSQDRRFCRPARVRHFRRRGVARAARHAPAPPRGDLHLLRSRNAARRSVDWSPRRGAVRDTRRRCRRNRSAWRGDLHCSRKRLNRRKRPRNSRSPHCKRRPSRASVSQWTS